MYLDFFKFKKNPFHITPDPDFLFLSPSHNVALSSISHAVEQRKGLVAVTGEVGVGKTTILRSYLEGTDPAKIRIVYIFNAALSFGKLMKQIVSELGIPAVDMDLPHLIDSLFLYLIDEYKNDRRVVLIIDEAQMRPSTVKTVVCHETVKTDPIKFVLHFSLGHWIIRFGIPKNFFEQNTTRKCGWSCITHNLMHYCG